MSENEWESSCAHERRYFRERKKECLCVHHTDQCPVFLYARHRREREASIYSSNSSSHSQFGNLPTLRSMIIIIQLIDDGSLKRSEREE